MRCLGLVMGLGALVLAQEVSPREEKHDELGFPIIFNGEIVTENDVLRILGTDPGVIGSRAVLRSERDRVLRMKLEMEVAAGFGISVDDREVDAVVQREVDTRGGYAKFSEYLAQRGDTKARYEEHVRQQLLAHKMQWLFLTGITRDQQKLLPERVAPTPRELRIAWEKDPDRQAPKLLVRYYQLDIKLSDVELKKFRRGMLLVGADETERKMKVAVDKRLEEAMGELKAAPFPAVARKRGVKIDDQSKRWEKVEESKRPETVFLRTAKPESRSEPIRFTDGTGYRILYLIERKQPKVKGPTDPEISKTYTSRIRELRAQKWRAEFSIRALDRSTVRPARVKQQFRFILVAELKEADANLRRLGLH